MKNIIATIPSGRFKTWEAAEEVVRHCDGEGADKGKERFWTLRMPRPPKQNLIGSLCYMVGFGQVRGYFDIVDLDLAKNWDRYKEQRPNGFVLVLANWHPLIDGPEMGGFQGWRYTNLRPL